MESYLGKIADLKVNLFDSPGFLDMKGLKDEKILQMIQMKMLCNQSTQVIDGIIFVHALDSTRIRLEEYFLKVIKSLGIEKSDLQFSLLLVITKGEQFWIFDQDDDEYYENVLNSRIGSVIKNYNIKHVIKWSNNFKELMTYHKDYKKLLKGNANKDFILE